MSSHVNKVEETVAEIAVKFISQAGFLFGLCLMQATKAGVLVPPVPSKQLLSLFVCFLVEISLVT